MPVNYPATVATPRLQVVADLIAGKTIAAATGTATAGTLVIGTSALSGATGVLASIPLPATALTVSGKVATLQGVPLSATASATGTAALAEFRNDSGTVVVSGLTVGTSGTDIVLDSAAISSGQSVSITSGTITAP
ncbi:hypothetical protein [Methylobacterium brachiatum]|uniref:hypothetical protein n=1 Tax=Methylobacterium brachiatum TaxID=269660 RepID=UPI000EFC9962|nr:hypothetical protein [Methylobacterium brachiatum]AYO83564.1 hypothetical protein EBB05_15675 [Methylobacterium brachiatum]